MPEAPVPRPAWQRWIIRHLFIYLAILAGLAVIVSVLAARTELSDAVGRLGPGMALLVLSLSAANYAIRFLKWQRLLADSAIPLPALPSARIYFACLSMVVTPARLGELYKLVFLRRLHGIGASRSLPPLVIERATDALALLALCAAQPFDGPARLGGVGAASLVLIGIATLLARPATRRPFVALAARMPFLRGRTARIDELLAGHALLLRPRSFAWSLGLSIAAWWAECVGLLLICRGLGAALGLGESTWIYSASTLLGNLTFLPGGLGSTELVLKVLLERVGTESGVALAATLLVRAATLWFAVGIGLAVTLLARRRLQWSEATREAAGAD